LKTFIFVELNESFFFWNHCCSLQGLVQVTSKRGGIDINMEEEEDEEEESKDGGSSSRKVEYFSIDTMTRQDGKTLTIMVSRFFVFLLYL
jgi:hypothetical protein